MGAAPHDTLTDGVTTLILTAGSGSSENPGPGPARSLTHNTCPRTASPRGHTYCTLLMGGAPHECQDPGFQQNVALQRGERAEETS